MDFTIVRSLLIILVLVIVVWFVAQAFNKTPRYPPAYDMTSGGVEEGFFGGVVRGSGHPDCLRTLQGSAEVMSMVMAAAGNADYNELQIILSKLACLKKDLMSPSGIVEATRYQPYMTSHDREPVAEVTAQCLSQTIPSRDLDIIFLTWKNRGKNLLRRLCTEANLKEDQVKKAEAIFEQSWADVYDVARGRCLASPGQKAAAAHEPAAFESQEDTVASGARSYDGYFSGWTGQI
jgi:hypothetical protein